MEGSGMGQRRVPSGVCDRDSGRGADVATIQVGLDWGKGDAYDDICLYDTYVTHDPTVPPPHEIGPNQTICVRPFRMRSF